MIRIVWFAWEKKGRLLRGRTVRKWFPIASLLFARGRQWLLSRWIHRSRRWMVKFSVAFRDARNWILVGVILILRLQCRVRNSALLMPMRRCSKVLLTR